MRLVVCIVLTLLSGVSQGAEGQEKLPPVTEKSLSDRYDQIEAEIQPILKDIANGKYNGPLPLNEVLARLERAKTQLKTLKAEYDALEPGQKTDRQIGMRFLTLGKMGFASLEAQIGVVQRQADAVKAEMARLAPTLVKALEDPSNEVRATAAEALRAIVAADPACAPDYHDKTHWEKEIAKLNVGMRLDEAVKLLLPNATPAQRKEAVLVGAWSGQTGFSMLRLDDYWTITFYLTDVGQHKLVEAPVLNRSVRPVWVSPPKDYTGPWTTWFVNGQKANENQYRNGQHDGAFTAFHDNGSKSYEQHYVNGTCHGADTGWYRSGKKMYVGQYKNGKQDGLWQHWYENGTPQTVRDYRDREFSGIYATWYENGQKQSEQHYRNGKLDGLDMSWDQNGKVQWMRTHRNGQLIESK